MSRRSRKPTTPMPEPPPELSVTEAARNFADIVNRVRYRGERFTLTNGGLPVAELRPPAMSRVVTAGSLASRLATVPHLGATAAARLGTDIDDARRNVGAVGAGPWE